MEYRTTIKAASGAATSYGKSNANPDGVKPSSAPNNDTNNEVAITLRQEITDGNNAVTRNSNNNDGPQAPHHVVLRGSTPTPRWTCAVCGAVWAVGAMANGCHNCGRGGGERGKGGGVREEQGAAVEGAPAEDGAAEDGAAVGPGDVSGARTGDAAEEVTEEQATAQAWINARAARQAEQDHVREVVQAGLFALSPAELDEETTDSVIQRVQKTLGQSVVEYRQLIRQEVQIFMEDREEEMEMEEDDMEDAAKAEDDTQEAAAAEEAAAGLTPHQPTSQIAPAASVQNQYVKDARVKCNYNGQDYVVIINEVRAHDYVVRYHDGSLEEVSAKRLQPLRPQQKAWQKAWPGDAIEPNQPSQHAEAPAEVEAHQHGRCCPAGHLLEQTDGMTFSWMTFSCVDCRRSQSGCVVWLCTTPDCKWHHEHQHQCWCVPCAANEATPELGVLDDGWRTSSPIAYGLPKQWPNVVAPTLKDEEWSYLTHRADKVCAVTPMWKSTKLVLANLQFSKGDWVAVFKGNGEWCTDRHLVVLNAEQTSLIAESLERQLRECDMFGEAPLVLLGEAMRTTPAGTVEGAIANNQTTHRDCTSVIFYELGVVHTVFLVAAVGKRKSPPGPRYLKVLCVASGEERLLKIHAAAGAGSVAVIHGRWIHAGWSLPKGDVFSKSTCIILYVAAEQAVVASRQAVHMTAGKLVFERAEDVLHKENETATWAVGDASWLKWPEKLPLRVIKAVTCGSKPSKRVHKKVVDESQTYVASHRKETVRAKAAVFMNGDRSNGPLQLAGEFQQAEAVQLPALQLPLQLPQIPTNADRSNGPLQLTQEQRKKERRKKQELLKKARKRERQVAIAPLDVVHDVAPPPKKQKGDAMKVPGMTKCMTRCARRAKRKKVAAAVDHVVDGGSGQILEAAIEAAAAAAAEAASGAVDEEQELLRVEVVELVLEFLEKKGHTDLGKMGCVLSNKPQLVQLIRIR